MATLPLSQGYLIASKPNAFHRPCPYCGSKAVHRSRARGIIERHIVRFFRLYPHRCECCDRRFYVRVSDGNLP
jgi:hypothetical protein